MDNLLEIDSVYKAYGDNQVLTDIYLKCRTGDIIGLLGRNGSGKSTLLQIIFGTMAAQKFISINGKKVEKPYLQGGEVCYLPQHEFLPKQITVEKVCQIFLDKKAVNKFLDEDLLRSISKTKIQGLSGGEVRYLEIKLLLYTKSKFVLLDEPFNGMAPIMIESIKQLIKSKSNTKGIILTDHDYQNVFDIANKMCLLYDGGIKKLSGKQDLVDWGYISGNKL